MIHRVALFDLDNTLVDRQAAFRRWAHEWRTAKGLPSETVDWLVANDDDGYRSRTELMQGAVDRFGLDRDPVELVDEYREQFPICFTPDQAVINGLRRLRELDWRTVVVTNGPSTQRAKLASAGLDAELDAVVVSSEVGERKPSPIIFQVAAEAVGLPTAGGWMVGDSAEADIRGAADLGLNTI